MEAEAKPSETPEAFLRAVGETLRAQEGADLGLADILKAHILKITSTQNAVAQAKRAILELAAERASYPQPDAKNG